MHIIARTIHFVPSLPSPNTEASPGVIPQKSGLPAPLILVRDPYAGALRYPGR